MEREEDIRRGEKTAKDVASEVLDVIISAYPEGVALADVKEIFNIIEDEFTNTPIVFLDS